MLYLGAINALKGFVHATRCDGPLQQVIYGRDEGSRSNEGIGSRVVMLTRRRIRTEYLGEVEDQVTRGLVLLQASD